jgi:rhodanese-related sulfurtransferase
VTKKQILSVVLRAATIAVVFSCMGLGVNALAPEGIPWIYVPPVEVVVAGVKVPLVDAKEAFKFFAESDTVFLDTRRQDDYRERRIKGAIFLPPDDVQEQFLAVQPLLPEDSRIILYCYGPECDMAERVAEFLAPMGYRNMMIMTAGLRGWEQAGYPTEGEGKKN